MFPWVYKGQISAILISLFLFYVNYLLHTLLFAYALEAFLPLLHFRYIELIKNKCTVSVDSGMILVGWEKLVCNKLISLFILSKVLWSTEMIIKTDLLSHN